MQKVIITNKFCVYPGTNKAIFNQKDVLKTEIIYKQIFFLNKKNNNKGQVGIQYWL